LNQKLELIFKIGFDFVRTGPETGVPGSIDMTRTGVNQQFQSRLANHHQG